MVKGEKRKNYNDFEEELNHIAGYVGDKYGLDFFFEHVFQTFTIAEKAILKHSSEYKEWFDNEDFETKQSVYFNDPQYEININPLTDMLYKSHFITIHSEFENTWKEIVQLYNNYFPPRDFFSLNDKFLTPKFFNASCLLDRVVNKHQVLLSYNYVRNKIVHQNAVTTSPEYTTLMKFISSGDINFLKVSVDGFKAYFIIEDIKFIREYGNKISGFVLDIADTSFSERQHVS